MGWSADWKVVLLFFFVSWKKAKSGSLVDAMALPSAPAVWWPVVAADAYPIVLDCSWVLASPSDPELTWLHCRKMIGCSAEYSVTVPSYSKEDQSGNLEGSSWWWSPMPSSMTAHRDYYLCTGIDCHTVGHRHMAMHSYPTLGKSDAWGKAILLHGWKQVDTLAADELTEKHGYYRVWSDNL